LSRSGRSASTGGSTATRNNTALAAVIVTATTSINPGATLSGSQIWSSAVATFKGAPPATNAPAGTATGTGAANDVTFPAATNAPAGLASGTGEAQWSAAYAAAILADSPSGHWRLGEATGTNAADIGSVNNPGTYQATPTLGVAGALAGDTDTAVSFASASLQYVSIPDNAAYSLTTTTQLTLEAWAKPSVDGAQGTILGKGSAPYEWRLERSGGNFYRVQVMDSTGALRASAISPLAYLAASGWHHIVATIDNAAPLLTLYVDGASVASTATFTSTSTDTTSRVTIGAAR